MLYVPSEPEVAPHAPDRARVDERVGDDARAALAVLVRRELFRPAPAAVEPMVAEIRRRHGDAVAAILLYGSCLRTGRYDEGVLDFYVLVDRYRDVHASRFAALANAVLPPSVYYLEVNGGAGTLRAKYAVLSRRHFLAGASLACFQSVVWARFCQPAVLVHARDPEAVTTVVHVATASTRTMVLVGAALSPHDDATTRVRPDDLWRRGLAETYGAELRVERPVTIRALYAAAPDRYDLAARLAVEILVQDGVLRGAGERHDVLELAMDPAVRRAVRRRWARRRWTGKPLAAARLLKALVTFGDAWAPYGLAKLERHTGIRLELTPRQRRWVWVALWPIIARLLLRRALH